MNDKRKEQKWDVVALGEALLRFSPPKNQHILQAQQFDAFVGGSENNTLAALSQLGRKCCWLSQQADHELAYLVERSLSAYQIDTSHVSRASSRDRQGIFFLNQTGSSGTRVIYDRRDSAASCMTPEDLPKEIFTTSNATLFHSTGITAAISKSMLATLTNAWVLAGKAGWKRSFDFNFRENLWSIHEAWKRCRLFMQQADVVFIAMRDIRKRVPDDHNEDTKNWLQRDYLNWIREELESPLLVITLGADGALALDKENNIVQQPSQAQGESGRIGRGDAFSAGFLDNWLSAASSIEQALKKASVCAAAKSSTPGDMALFNAKDIDAALAAGQSDRELQR